MEIYSNMFVNLDGKSGRTVAFNSSAPAWRESCKGLNIDSNNKIIINIVNRASKEIRI